MANMWVCLALGIGPDPQHGFPLIHKTRGTQSLLLILKKRAHDPFLVGQRPTILTGSERDSGYPHDPFLFGQRPTILKASEGDSGY